MLKQCDKRYDRDRAQCYESQSEPANLVLWGHKVILEVKGKTENQVTSGMSVSGRGSRM